MRQRDRLSVAREEVTIGNTHKLQDPGVIRNLERNRKHILTAGQHHIQIEWSALRGGHRPRIKTQADWTGWSAWRVGPGCALRGHLCLRRNLRGLLL